MQIVIDIDKEFYEIAFSDSNHGIALGALQALRRGVVLPEYEYHIDHTDCIWYGNDSGCPVTCSQYRDGWNDAMNYIFKGGKGYQPYRRDE